MKILIPHDITSTGMMNPYLFLLIRELHKLGEVTETQHGYGWLYEPGEWDVIHLHWPEYLVRSQLADKSRIDLLENRHFKKVTQAIKNRKSEGAKIMATVHNEKPHKDSTGLFHPFYKEIYQLSDGFIHMGEFSERMLREEYSETVHQKPHFVIPHGDYSYFSDDLDRSVCREKLNIRTDEKLLLSFGAVRSKEELELGIDAFQNAGIKKSVYIIAGSLPNPYRSQPEHFIARKKLYTNIFNKSIRTYEKVIGPEEVQIYLKAADLLFIPRFNTLNSGSTALGFTFGKVVTGPGYGVTGEILKKTGNPVFDPADLNSVSEAIRNGFALSEAGHGISNKEYANRHMDWMDIGVKTFQAYKSL